MSDDKKAREWWIELGNKEYCGAVYDEHPNIVNLDIIHVIEYAAYAELKAQVEKLNAEIKQCYCIHGKHPLDECDECWESNKSLKNQLTVEREVTAKLKAHAEKLAGQIMAHLNNHATSQNEALCLIRRDTENALTAYRKEFPK